MARGTSLAPAPVKSVTDSDTEGVARLHLLTRRCFLVLLVVSSLTAQAQTAAGDPLRLLSIPPGSSGTCSTMILNDSTVKSAWSGQPTLTFEIEAGYNSRRVALTTDSTGRQVRYMEMLSFVDTTGLGVTESIGAVLAPGGRVSGVRNRMALRPGQQPQRTTAGLDSTQQRLVQGLAAWVKQRCGR